MSILKKEEEIYICVYQISLKPIISFASQMKDIMIIKENQFIQEELFKFQKKNMKNWINMKMLNYNF